MARKKKAGKKGRDDDWSDQEDIPQGGGNDQKKVEEQQQQQSRKQKRQAKQQSKQTQNKKGSHSEDDDDDEDDNLAMLLGGGLNVTGDSEEDDEDESDKEILPQPPAKGNKKKGGAQARLQKMIVDSDEDEEEEEQEEEEEEEEEEENDDDEEVEQITFKILDDDSPKKDKKKKDKKEKKEKKHKKDKKKKKSKHHGSDEDTDDDSHHNDDSETHNAKDVAIPAVAAPEKKSKFQLQMEAAMKKKQEEEAAGREAVDTKTTAPGNSKTLTTAEVIPEVPDKLAGEEDEEDNDEIMYGHKDDVVWSDKSHADKQAEAAVEDDTHKLMYGKDGKKLSNKERKRLLKEREAAERAAEYEKLAVKASLEGAQFACSQTAFSENDPQWQNSLDINIPNFSISAAGKILFKDASLTIGHGRRYGLVGPNGRGKSTLLKMIASRDLKLPPRIDFLYVEQEVVADNTPAVEAVLRADTLRWKLMEEERALMTKVDAGDESVEVIERLGVVLEELTNMGADAMEAKARRILYGLGFTMDMQTKPTKMFSGGWRMRISLARALFVEPTLLMLDEPTNHLDLNAVIWLDEYLQTWKKTLLVVSHDQDFLNSVCQEMLHIEDLKLISYKGNYDSFKKAEKERLKAQIKAWEKQEKRLRELKKSGQSKAKAQEAVKKSNNQRESGARSQKKKNQAIAAGTETAETVELIKRPREYTVKLEFSEVPELSRPVIEVSNVHFRYSPKHPVIFEKVDFGIDMDSRICIVGPNGAGKSTLLKLLTGEVDPTSGEVRRNPRLRMGIYNQHFVDRLPMDKTPVEHLRDRFEDLDYQSCRNRLGRYGLEGHAHEVVMRDLSGGQKARVVFVELSLQMPHVLLLDEPSNNLDVETIDALCEAINEFNGGIVVVTHDQRMIEECDLTLWVVEKQGVAEWKEGFDDYKETILRQLEEEVEREAQARKAKVEAAAAAKAEKLALLAKKVKKK
ncbi:ABC transporter ATP-binding protein [Nitzschia inconspicua]|uniref:ABC transporter ATP-binding protein n=1 Tax=Nitzschia inconspicua TaxID=303405 RepID=A0A9K3L5G8_9STRA|nr:ABC transporter ATP-binding protein [Nitzschia inconspicua]